MLEGGAEPSWSADGETIAYTVLPGLDIGAFDLTAGSGEVLAADPSDEQDPDWSPDGQMFVFWSDRDGDAELYVAAADGSGVTRLTDHSGVDRNPAWGS